MVETTAPAPNGQTLPTPTSPSLLESRLFLFWVVVATIFLQIYNQGYYCYRLDHTSQIPLLYMRQDPGLYSRDWFLHDYGHFDLRKYPLFLMRLFALPAGLPAGILALYFITIGATLWAWLMISRRIYGTPLPGIVTGLMATFMYGQEIGTNHLLEKEMIPRTEAYPFAYFGLYCALCGRPFVAGLLLALGGLFQPAVGLLFALPILVWILTRRDGRGLRQAGLFLAGFVLPFSYRVFSLREAIQDNALLSPSEEILLAAYIRHPHHMVPSMWGTMWIMFALLAALFVVAWRRHRAEHSGMDQAARLGLILAVLLAVCTFFIEVVPQKLIVLVQPYRMAVLFYFVILLVISPYLLELLRRPEKSARLRALLIVMSPASRAFCSTVLAVELVLAAWERRRGRLNENQGWGVLALLVGVAWLIGRVSEVVKDDTQYLLIGPPAALALLAAPGVCRKYALAARRGLVHLAGAGLTLLGLAVIGCFFWLPLERWLNDSARRHPERLGALCWEYEFKPIPIKALERLGVWAEANTPKDALFLMPPKAQAEGFHIWSKRAAVFCFKFIPLKTSGLKEWRERYLALRGIGDPNAPAEKKAVQEAMRDYGGIDMDRLYHKLTAAQALGIARKYGADYIITQVKYDLDDPAHFKLLTQDYNYHIPLKKQKAYYLYQMM